MVTQKSTTPPASASPGTLSKTTTVSSQKELYPNILTLEEMEASDERHYRELREERRAMREAAAQAGASARARAGGVTTIRDELPGEAAAIARLVTEAFLTAPHAGGNEARIVDRLRAEGALLLSLVAEEAGRITGHIAASPATVGGGTGWACIAPLSVRPDRQRAGIGATLMRAALARLRESGAKGAVLVGDPGYYGRFGFAAAPGLTAAGIPGEYVQGLAFGGPAPLGGIVFHPAFGV